MKKFFVFLIFALPSLALAQETENLAKVAEHAREEAGIPVSVAFQTINFVLYAGILIWLLRHPVKKFFTGRQEAFRQALVKAEAARKDAETRKREIQERISALASTQQTSVDEARREAEVLRVRMMKDAEEMSQKLRDEASRSATNEISRAKAELREELLNQSVALSTKILTEKMAEPDQKRLQTEFVDKIQVGN